MLTQLKGVGEKTKKKLNELGIYDCRDLLFFAPASYLNLDDFASPYSLIEGEYVKIRASIIKKNSPFRKGALQMLRVRCVAQGKEFGCVWFNQNYTSRLLDEGAEYNFFGKIKFCAKNSFELVNPQLEKVSDKSKFTGIQPIYRTRGLLAQRTFAEIVANALTAKTEVFSVVPKSADTISLRQALVNLHTPKDFFCIEEARKRVALELTVSRLLAFSLEKSRPDNKRENKYYNSENSGYSELKLPFALTQSQSEVISKLIKGFCSESLTNSILCGDVGSGKTVVAIIMCYLTVKAGGQAAVMAPTEILACQHYRTFENLLSSLGVRSIMISSSLSAKERKAAADAINNGEVDIVIGTHALLNGKIEVPKLRFVVIDEQHRFGVAQRTALLSKGKDIDVLTLSATPIPRSMQLIAYGDLDFYTIDRRFCGNVKTRIVAQEKLPSMMNYIKDCCKVGKQAFIVLSKIEDSEGCETIGLKSFFEEAKKEYFADIPIALLHGKLKDAEKQTILSEFREKRLMAILSTTVVEVGIDIPDASIMAIMDADRFGLATLHQLRGRVGRDGEEAFCFLHTKKTDTARLTKMIECNDGMSLAEYDFSVKGGGDVFGTSQSGGAAIPNLTYEIIMKAKEIAKEVDISTIAPLLKIEARQYALGKISFT